MLKSFFVFIIFSLLSVASFGYQPSSVPFDWESLSNSFSIKKYSTSDGLPINSINHVVTHSDGFLFIATNDGLVQFDGDRFRTINTFTHPQLQTNRIKWMESSTTGELWVLDHQENLYRFKNGKITWLQGINGFEEILVKKTAMLNDSTLIITTDQGLFVNEEELIFKRLRYPETERDIRNSFITKQGELYFLIDEGLFLLSETRFSKIIGASELLVSVFETFHLETDRDGFVWILGVNGTVLRIEAGNRQTLFSYPEVSDIEFWDMLDSGNGEILFSTSYGLLALNKSNQELKPTPQFRQPEGYFKNGTWNSINNYLITNFQNTVYADGEEVLGTEKPITIIAEGEEGIIWVGTNGDGLYQITPNKMITIGDNFMEGLTNIYGLSEAEEGIWAAGFEQEIFKLSNTKIENWNTKNSSLKDPYFRAVLYTDENIFAGNFDLWSFDNKAWVKDNTWSINTELINALFIDYKGRFWISTASGLYLNSQSEKERFLDRNGRTLEGVKSVYNYFDKGVLFCTSSQGVAWLTNDGEFKFIGLDEGLSSNIVRDVYATSHDTIWVATEDRGLDRVILKNDRLVSEVSSLTTNDGLIDNSLHRLIEDDQGYFWINSNKGIMRISEVALNQYLDGERNDLPIKVFNEQNGLISREGNGGVQNSGILTKDGKLLFSSQAGIVYTRPEWHINPKPYSIKPVFESLSFSNSVVHISGASRVNLSSQYRSVQVKFTMPVFSDPENVEFFYKIEGVNETWQEAGRDRVAIFTNLPAGINTLTIRGRVKGEEGFTENSLELAVQPFFYETRWFLFLVLLGIGVVFWGGNRALIVRAKRREVELNDLVNLRTNELLEEKEKTEKVLDQVERLHQSKSEFFTNFTHELRTPLSLILNPIEDLLENDKQEISGKKELLNVMWRNAARLKQLVDQLLDVSRLNAGELLLTFEAADLYKTTSQFCSQFEYSFEKEGINFSINDKVDLEKVLIDVNAWNHICTNLMGNALKFSNRGGEISIQFFDEADYLACVFKDTGIGISHDDLPYIFDSYYRGESTISKAQGAGIGLTLVKGLVERMGGKIEVSSIESEGTVFTIYLRKGSDHILAKDKIIEHSKDKAIVRASLSGNTPSTLDVKQVGSEARVLIVEDNEDFQKYLKYTIGRHYEVLSARNGKEALQLLINSKPDIIISDVMMPEMNGFEMIEAIRSKKGLERVPVIFLSAKDTVADIEKGLSLGADIYLSKPVEVKLLLLQIMALLKRERRIKSIKKRGSAEKSPDIIQRVEEVIQRHLGDPGLNVEMIASKLSISSPTLYRKWKKHSTETINYTISKMRFEEALRLIREESITISEAAYTVGFSHSSYFSNSFKKIYGLSPQEYLRKFMDG